MECLWSRAVATGGNGWQMKRLRTRLKQAKTVAVGCDRLPEEFHGKEGVDGSSPSEGSAKASEAGAFRSPALADCPSWRWGMEPFMEPSGSERVLQTSEIDAFAGTTGGPHRCRRTSGVHRR